MIIQVNYNEPAKAGNQKAAIAKKIEIDLVNKTIIHKYDSVLIDSDGDVVEGSAKTIQSTIDSEEFDVWITQQVIDATVDHIDSQINATE